MKLHVRVKPQAKKESVIQKDGLYVVSVRARAMEGKANEAVCRALAKHFRVPRTAVEIVSGHGSRSKWISVVVY